jgi:hypothetical protein
MDTGGVKVKGKGRREPVVDRREAPSSFKAPTRWAARTAMAAPSVKTESTNPREHASRGLVVFCAPSGGWKHGATGTNVCPDGELGRPGEVVRRPGSTATPSARTSVSRRCRLSGCTSDVGVPRRPFARHDLAHSSPDRSHAAPGDSA